MGKLTVKMRKNERTYNGLGHNPLNFGASHGWNSCCSDQLSSFFSLQGKQLNPSKYPKPWIEMAPNAVAYANMNSGLGSRKTSRFCIWAFILFSLDFMGNGPSACLIFPLSETSNIYFLFTFYNREIHLWLALWINHKLLNSMHNETPLYLNMTLHGVWLEPWNVKHRQISL